ncbi:hypothetical protein UPYG_G00176460 [Umbra pygmaea]|uniref:Integrase catalytic domain-containing protein n=1 Tax=Umbra pygmaea TaxID=75934 RepID=A0ABD0WPT1_UMBPY
MFFLRGEFHCASCFFVCQVSRVRESLRRVDPYGTELRALANHTLHRRQYSVPAPNAMWHIDGNHKLIRWRFVIHGGIDGFSRFIVYLTAATNNRASTVLDSFLVAVNQFGVPSRVWSDKGMENIEVAHFMVQNRGENRHSHITGRSVHNQRNMEAEGILDPDNEIHVFALHWSFLPQLQRQLHFFKEAWNLHGLRTEGHQSPNLLWTRFREAEDPDMVEGDYGIDWDGPHEPEATGLPIPDVVLPRDLTAEKTAGLPDRDVSLMDAVDVYTQTVEQLMDILGELA